MNPPLIIFQTSAILQVLPNHRRTFADRPPTIRHGCHFALAAEAAAFKANPVSADLFSTVPPQDVTNGGSCVALLPSSPAGAYFAHKLGLAEGTRLRKLSTASDIKCLLENRGTRDDVSKITATALRRNILLLAPTAKSFLKETVNDIAAWELLKAKGLLNLQEQLRTGSHEAQAVPAAKTVAPLPPLPPSTSLPGSSGKAPATAVPLAVGFCRGSSSNFRLELRSTAGGACQSCRTAITCAACGRTTEGGKEQDARGGAVEGPARQPDGPLADSESPPATAPAGTAGGATPLLGGGRTTARDIRLEAGAEGRQLEVEAAQPTDSTVWQQPQDRVVPTKRAAATAPEGANKSREREVGAAATAPTNDVPPKQHVVYGVPYIEEKAPPLSNAQRSKRRREKRQERAQAEAEEHIDIFA